MTLRPTTHQCACRSCGKVIPINKIACLHHWLRLPAALHAEIIANWRYGLQYRCHPAHSYLESIAKARACWAEQDAAREAKRFRMAMG